MELFSLKEKSAVVTGGGTGIGFGIASGLLEAGADVVCVYSSHEPTELMELGKTLGRRVVPVQADLKERDGIKRAYEEALKALPGISILVNNAGICPRSPALDYTEQMWDDVIAVDESAVFFLSQLFARHWVENKTPGKIINLASMLSFLGGFNTAAYTASKHAVVGITKVLANEWAPYHINVNAIAPGWIKTNLSAPLRKDPERDASVKARIPMGDWGDPSDFKGVVVLLASAASDYITGVVIPVDGGYLTK